MFKAQPHPPPTPPPKKKRKKRKKKKKRKEKNEVNVFIVSHSVNENGIKNTNLSIVICSHNISRVPNQNGVSLLYIILEIHYSGREPSNFVHNTLNKWGRKGYKVEIQSHYAF